MSSANTGNRLADPGFVCGAKWRNERLVVAEAAVVEGRFVGRAKNRLEIERCVGIGREERNVDGRQRRAERPAKHAAAGRLFSDAAASPGRHQVNMITDSQPLRNRRKS